MKVRRESVQTRSETGTRRRIDLLRSIRLMYHNSKIQGILVQYVEGLNGKTARHSRVSALAAEASVESRCGAMYRWSLPGDRPFRLPVPQWRH